MSNFATGLAAGVAMGGSRSSDVTIHDRDRAYDAFINAKYPPRFQLKVKDDEAVLYHEGQPVIAMDKPSPNVDVSFETALLFIAFVLVIAGVLLWIVAN